MSKHHVGSSKSWRVSSVSRKPLTSYPCQVILHAPTGVALTPPTGVVLMKVMMTDPLPDSGLFRHKRSSLALTVAIPHQTAPHIWRATSIGERLGSRRVHRRPTADENQSATMPPGTGAPASGRLAQTPLRMPGGVRMRWPAGFPMRKWTLLVGSDHPTRAADTPTCTRNDVWQLRTTHAVNHTRDYWPSTMKQPGRWPG